MIGGWGHASGVLQQMEALGGCELVGIAKALPEEEIAHFRQFESVKTAKVYEDYRQMLREAKPEVVIVGTRLDRIAAVAMDAARAGCHLICEKPLAIDHAALAELYETVVRAKVQCIPMLANRVNPLVRAAREAINSGRLGKIALVNARKSYKWGGRPEWFGKRSLYGGTIGWIGIHALDFIEAATGQTFAAVAAMQSNVGHPERPECEDNCGLMLRLSRGGQATVSIDLLRPEAAATWGDDWIRIVGTKGTIEASLERGEGTITTMDGPPQNLPATAKSALYADFLKNLREKPTEQSENMQRGFWLTHVCLCARDAADQGRIVEIDPRPYALAGPTR